MLRRDFYLNQIINSMWDGQVKVITGLRRVGKSVLLFELFKNYLIDNHINKNQIITLSLDQRKYYKFRNPITLCEYVEDLIKDSTQKYYLFIDEVQLSKTVIDSENDDIPVTIYDMLNELKSYLNTHKPQVSKN